MYKLHARVFIFLDKTLSFMQLRVIQVIFAQTRIHSKLEYLDILHLIDSIIMVANILIDIVVI